MFGYPYFEKFAVLWGAHKIFLKMSKFHSIQQEKCGRMRWFLRVKDEENNNRRMPGFESSFLINSLVEEGMRICILNVEQLTRCEYMACNALRRWYAHFRGVLNI